jgi:hypothetical protein
VADAQAPSLDQYCMPHSLRSFETQRFFLQLLLRFLHAYSEGLQVGPRFLASFLIDLEDCPCGHGCSHSVRQWAVGLADATTLADLKPENVLLAMDASAPAGVVAKLSVRAAKPSHCQKRNCSARCL